VTTQPGLLRELEIDARTLGMLGALAGIWLVLDLATGGLFLTARNLYNLAVQSSVVGVMAAGMVFVIVARHIDLSVGSVLGFTGMVIATLQAEVLPVGAAWNWPLTVLAGLALGAGIGAFQGWWIAYRGLPAFVVTLAGLLMFRGGAFLVTDGRTVAPLDPGFGRLGGGLDGSIGATWSWLLGAGAIAVVALRTLRARRARRDHGVRVRPLWADALRLALATAAIVGFVWVMNAYTRPRSDVARGIPVPVLILIAVVLSMTFAARLTRFGRWVWALGGNPEAVALAGVDVRRLTLRIFVVMGLLCGVAAVLTTARLNAGTNSMGTLAELNVIAAAVLGGTSLAGGAGSVGAAILGAVLMQSLDNGMLLLGVSSPLRQVAIGLILIGAVWLDSVYRRRRAA
jgi:D-xylose transport system permease protein